MVTVGSFTPGIPLDREAACVFPRFRHVMGELHAEKMIHVGAEGLFDAQGYLRSQRGLAMQKVGELARRTCRICAAFETHRPRASMTSVLIRSPGWSGFFIELS
jgi:hypothetical protein